MDRTLPSTHFLLALLVMAVWGTNFVVMKFTLGQLPPVTLAALRFTCAALPAVFFCRRPAGWGNLAAYGVLIGAVQFAAMYVAMDGHISPGLASLVVQVQAFFTIGLAAALTGERLRAYQLAGLALAGAGLAWLMLHANGDVTPLGLVLVLGAALGWAGGNMVSRRAGRVNMFAYVVWSSLLALPVLYGLALAFEGPGRVASSILHAEAATWVGVLWQSVANSLFGYAVWGWLLARHPAASVTPLSLLVPVFGIGASAGLGYEPLTTWKLTATALVLSGLAVNSLWPRLAIIPPSRPR